MTQEELANLLHVSFQSISQWERDKRKPKQETLQRIANAIGCPIRHLLYDPFKMGFHDAPFVSDKQGHLDIWIDSRDLEFLEIRAEEEGTTLENYLAEYLHVDNDNFLDEQEKPVDLYE